MTLGNFDSELKESQVNKGYNYFHVGNVTELKKARGNKWTATVTGTENYDVTISLRSRSILECDCDCPHEVEYCKHVIAVLYAIREEGESATSRKKAQKQRIENRKDIYIEEIKAYIKQDDKMALKYEDRHDSALFRKQLDGLLKKAKTSFKGGNFANAADIALALIETTSDMVYNRDNSGVITGECIDNSMKLLFAICDSEIPEELRQRLYETAMSFFSSDIDWQTMAVLAASDKKVQEDLMVALDKKLTAAAEIKDHFKKEDRIKDLLCTKHFLLERMGRPEEAEDLRKQHRDHSICWEILRKQKVKIELGKGDIDKAKELLYEGIYNRANGHIGMASYYQRILNEMSPSRYRDYDDGWM